MTVPLVMTGYFRRGCAAHAFVDQTARMVYSSNCIHQMLEVGDQIYQMREDHCDFVRSTCCVT